VLWPKLKVIQRRRYQPWGIAPTRSDMLCNEGASVTYMAEGEALRALQKHCLAHLRSGDHRAEQRLDVGARAHQLMAG
jgi:hypothetical protein